MALAGSGVADRDDVLAPLDVFRARQLHDEYIDSVKPIIWEDSHFRRWVLAFLL